LLLDVARGVLAILVALRSRCLFDVEAEMSTDSSPVPVRSSSGSGRSSSALLSPGELAALLGVPLPTIYRWRSHRQGPVGFRIGRHVRYSLEDVHEWLESRRDETSVERLH
jgi:excisionase family DNA binding protein